MRKFSFLFAALILTLLAACISCAALHCPPRRVISKPYGIFIGLNPAHVDQLAPYQTVVIEPSVFSAAQIQALHDAGKTVYGYLNIGAIEKSRPYYARFAALTLAPYENWDDERWINVAAPVWQAFVVNELGAQYAALGLDGFFLDNSDVYALYPRENMFKGLCAILRGLKQYQLPCILNGGDVFVDACMDRGIADNLFDGINQESVFTRIDFENNRYTAQDSETRRYFQDYLKRAAAAKLKVYLLEYRASPELSSEIEAYCRQNGFAWYNAANKDLQ